MPVNEIHQHLIAEYNKSKYPIFSLTKLKNKFGHSAQQQITQLTNDGIIKQRPGMNALLVELIQI